MSVSRGSGSLRTFSIGTRWASMIAQVVFLGRVLARSWRQTFARRGVSSRPVVALTLIGLVASLAFSVVLVPLAGPASATSPAGTGGMQQRIRSVATHRDELIVEERKKVATEAGDAAAMAELSELSGAAE